MKITIERDESEVEKKISSFLADMQGVTLEEMEELRGALRREQKALYYAENLLLELIGIKKEEQAGENTTRVQLQSEEN